MHNAKKILSVPIIFFLKALISAYQYIISPLTPPSCRFLPTCSQYTKDAIDKHGVQKGMILAVKRISKCHPWGTSGFDPVPEKQIVSVKK